MRNSGFCLLTLSLSPFFAFADPPPTTNQALAIPVEEQPFDPAEHALGDPFSARSNLARHGISIDPNLIIDDTQNFTGGLSTHENSLRERFNLAITLDSDSLLGYHGGTLFAVYQFQQGGHSSHELIGDVQNINFGTNGDGRSQLGQLWYQQKFLDDTLRLRAGKIDANSDFDVLDNGQEFLNNSFSTSPTLGLMPSFPDNGTGIQLFYEPPSGFYAGAGIFDGSGARGFRTGEYGPKRFLDRGDDLFLITELGQRYKLSINNHHFPGKIAVGGWYDTNPFPTVDASSTQSGTGGVYLVFDQLLWKPAHQRPIPAGTPGLNPPAQPEEQEYPNGIASTFSLSYADPSVNRVDGNLLGGLVWTGPIPTRDIDVLGLGATLAHLADDADTRHPYELAIESFYRIRITRWISLKPDLQYVIHPNGSGNIAEPAIGDALVATLRLEMSF